MRSTKTLFSAMVGFSSLLSLIALATLVAFPPPSSVLAQNNNMVLDCTYTSFATGAVYNLSTLFRSPSDPTMYLVIDPTFNHTFHFNICGFLYDTVAFFPNCSAANNCSVCQIDGNGNSHNAGQGDPAHASFGDLVANPSQGLTLNYTMGDMCNRAQAPRNTTITIYCNPRYTTPVIGANNVESGVETNNSCQYAVAVNASAGCPVAVPGPPNGKNIPIKLSAGSAIFIVLIVVMVLYCGGGFMYNSQVKGRRGWEAMPNSPFWLKFFGLVGDGFKYVGRLFGGGSSTPYQSVTSVPDSSSGVGTSVVGASGSGGYGTISGNS